MEKQSFPDILLTNLSQFIEPLKQLKDRPENIPGYLGSLGITPPDNFGEIITISVDIDAEVPSDGTATSEQRTSIIGNINTLLKALDESGIPDLPERIFNDLVYKYLRRYRPKLFAILHIFGIIQKDDENLPEIRWDRVGKIFSAPGEIMQDPDLYNWGGKFNSAEFFQRMSVLFGAFSLPGGVYERKESIELRAGDLGPDDFRIPIFMAGTYGEDDYAEITLNLAELIEDEDLSGIFLYPRITGSASIAFDISESWELVLSSEADLENGLGFSLMPPLELDFVKDLFDSPADFVDFELKLTLQRKSDAEPMIIFGDEESSSMTVSDVSIPIFAGLKDGTFDLGAEMNIENIILSIKGGDADGFISTLIPEEGITNTFGLGLGYSVKRGFYLTDSTSLEFSFSTNITLGPIELQQLGFYINPSADGVEIGATTQILANIGPLVAIVEEMGLRFNFPLPAEGEKGIPTPTIGFKPPAGIGLSINTPVVSGGGYLYFDYDKGEYAGVGEISVKEVFNVTAIAIITTKPPAGATEPGFSLLIIIAAELPPIQLGFGFTLNGVGGLFAANRTMDLDALRAGVSNGTIDNLLFPTDPVKNAPQIIDQMGAVFPVEAGAFTFGVMAKLGWGTPTLISLEVGLIVKVPAPIKIVIVGVLKAVLPEEKTPILALVVSFVGTIDPENELITFDASLEGSQLLGLKLYGEMAFRLRWGNDPMFLLSVGGFHPEFTPPAINLPSTFRRITLEILPDNPKLTLTGYFAITPNTLQFGAGVDLYIKKGKFNITGFCKFNTLIQFNPFYLSISLDAGLSVKWGKMELLGVYFGGSLSGPGPWVAKGYAEFKVVVKIKVNVRVKFGDRLETNQPTIKVLQLILDELAIDDNYEVLFPRESKILGSSRYEDDREREELSEEQKLLLHPAGKLSFKQLKVPLNVQLEKIGTRFVKGDKNFSLTMTNKDEEKFDTEDLQENFAPGEYFDLSLKQKLSRPSFEKYDGGLTMSDEAFSFSDDLEMDLIYESDSVDVTDDKESSKLKDGLNLRSEVGINKHLFDMFRKVNTVHNQNVTQTPSVVVKENSVSVVTPEIALAYDGNSLEAVFTNFNDVNQFKNNLLFTGEFDQQEIIPQYELFD